MSHVRLKPSKEFEIDFHPSELDYSNIPKESKKYSQEYLSSNKLAEHENFDIMIMLESKVIYGYDYIYQNKKLILPEVDPITIFFSNAVMSYGRLQHYKIKLLEESSKADETGMSLDLNLSGDFFQPAINCIINLQASLESFANRIIPEDYLFIDKTGNKIFPTVSYKLYNVVPKIKLIDFKQAKNKKHNKAIDKLIQLRNDIIHLKPAEKTNTGYKGTYREILDFDFIRAFNAVKSYINFYQENLVSECPCGNDYFFDKFKSE
ncbi:hypothetical protein [Flavobacterium sp. RSSB_23]|uniref:hypothetical protein n=1 Tax=Flavobacterium sp. RSSB_23 TaxID=3447668 RepID=UPI003F365425